MGLNDHFDNTYRELDTQPKCLTCDQWGVESHEVVPGDVS